MGEDLDQKGDFTGKPMHETVEEYASNLDTWINDFVNVYEKMGQKGNSDLVEGPKDILTSRCCIHSSVKYNSGDYLETMEVDNALACQSKCKDKQECNWFVYDTVTNNCKLVAAKPVNVEYNGNNWLGGPPSCPQDENSCNAYKTI